MYNTFDISNVAFNHIHIHIRSFLGSHKIDSNFIDGDKHGLSI